MTDKPPDKGKPEETAPLPEPKTPARTSQPKPSKTPLEQTVEAFVTGFDKRAFAHRLLVELRVAGIESLDDLGPHRLGDVNRALRATLRADAHAFYAAAAEFRSEE